MKMNRILAAMAATAISATSFAAMSISSASAADEIAKALSGLKAVAVLDKADSLNAAGGALFEDVTSGMYVNKKTVPMCNYINGIGGRDVSVTDIESVFDDLQEIVSTGKIENPYRYLGLRNN